MEEAKAELERKISRVLKFVQSKNKNTKETKKALIALVKDLQDKCQALFHVIDDFKIEYDKKVHYRRRKSWDAYSSSSSDSEYFSSEKSNNKISDAVATDAELKDELRVLKLEHVDLKHKLTDAGKKKEALNIEYLATLEKLQQAKALKENLRNEASIREAKFAAQIKELEELNKNKATKAKRLEKENKSLNSRIMELKLILKEQGDDILSIGKNFGDDEKKLTSRIEDLTVKLNNSKLEVDLLCAQNDELVGSVNGKKEEEADQFMVLMEKVKAAQHELTSLLSQKKEMTHLLDAKNKEISRIHSQLKCLEEDNRRFRRKVQNLEHELSTLQERRLELEDELTSKNIELNLLENKRIQLESQIRKENQGYSQSVFEMEDQNAIVGHNIIDQQRILKEKEEIIQRLMNKVQEQENKVKEQEKILNQQKDTTSKPHEGQKLTRRLSIRSSRDLKLNQAALEKKMEELAKDFQMKMEDNIKILNRRIHVAEQIYIENKNNLKKTQDASQTDDDEDPLPAHQTLFQKVKDMLQVGCSSPPEYNLVIKKLEEDGNLAHRISKLVDEIKLATAWVSSKSNEVEELKREVKSLVAKLECKEAQEPLLKMKLSKLEARLGEESMEKLNCNMAFTKLQTKVEELEYENRQKDEKLLSLGEEKKEAIRQLCMLIDYERCRFDHLKSLINLTKIKG